MAGWKFPLNNQGSDDGFNDSGIAHFSGAKFLSLVREIIQNSLDARDKSQEEPVRVEFDVVESTEFPERDQLRKIFQQCRKESKNRNDEKAEKFFSGGLEILKHPKIRMLKASDFNTTGLHTKDGRDLFHSLTKGRGISDKAAGAGGSFGIGKSAPYVFSGLRTVFYSTLYKKDGRAVRKAQGRSILMSHDGNDGRTQGTGFYGEEKNLKPVMGGNIPEFLSRDQQGTTVAIAGFNEEKWQDYILAAVVSSFFAAIDQGKLCVSIGEHLTIDKESLLGDFDNLLSVYGDNDDFAEVWLGYYLYDALKNGEERDIQLRSGLGHCKLRVLTGDDLPQQVGLIRRTGMLITADYKRLQRFPGMGDFVAVCTCDNEAGDDWLRRMENPQHNAFEPDRLEDDALWGENALKELAAKIRERIKEIVASTESDSVLVDEMKEFFAAEGDDNGNEQSEDRDFERGVVITRRDKSPKLPPLPKTDTIDPIPPGPGPVPPRESVDLRNIRIIAGDGERERVAYFTPAESGKVDLDVWIIGDEHAERLPLTEDTESSASGFNLVKGKRTEFIFKAAHDVRGAMRVVAHREADEDAD